MSKVFVGKQLYDVKIHTRTVKYKRTMQEIFLIFFTTEVEVEDSYEEPERAEALLKDVAFRVEDVSYIQEKKYYCYENIPDDKFWNPKTSTLDYPCGNVVLKNGENFLIYGEVKDVIEAVFK